MRYAPLLILPSALSFITTSRHTITRPISSSSLLTSPLISPLTSQLTSQLTPTSLTSFSIDDIDNVPSDSSPSDPKYDPKYDFVDDQDGLGDWKDTIDELLSPQTPQEMRLTLLKDLLNSDEEIRNDITAALTARDPSLLLSPNARAIRDGTSAVAYQLTNDILPSLSNPLSPTSPSTLRTSVPKAASQIFNAVQTQVENLRNGDDVGEKVREGMEVVAKSVRDAVAMEGDEGPPYTVLKKSPGFTIRSYSPYTVASTTMREVGGKWDENDVVLQGVAFNLLAGYVFGGNRERRTMELKMPVETTSLGSMRFYLGPPATPSSPYPTPLTFENKINELGAVTIDDVPSKVVAVRTFKGFVTQQESKRQLQDLISEIERDPDVELDANHGERVPYIVSRYNPPYTVPVVRRNEIAVPVAYRGKGEGNEGYERGGLNQDEIWEMVEPPSDVE